jgi:hypothetical protein
MRVLRACLRVCFNLLLLWIGWRMLTHNAQRAYLESDGQDVAYGRGNAPEEVRSEVLSVLKTFDEGYRKRDLTLLVSFMNAVFSRDQVLVLGTMPREVYSGFGQAARLVADDWKSWGDCRFQVARAHVSSNGDTAWISTVGQVRFDLSRFLVVPLRLSGVLAKEPAGWRFRQMQFQFDIDYGMALALEFLLLGWLLVNVLLLSLSVWRALRHPPAGSAPSGHLE